MKNEFIHLEKLKKTIQKGISKNLSENQLFQDKSFQSAYKEYVVFENSELDIETIEKYYNELVTLSDKKVLHKIQNSNSFDEQIFYIINFIIFLYKHNRASIGLKKRLVSLLIDKLLHKESNVSGIEGFKDLMGFILSKALELRIDLGLFYKEYKEEFITYTLKYCNETDIKFFAKTLSNIEKHDLKEEIGNILLVFNYRFKILNEDHFYFLRIFCKGSNTYNETYEEILLYFFKNELTKYYDDFEKLVKKTLTDKFYFKKFHLSLEKNNLSAAEDCLDTIKWDKNGGKGLEVFYSELKILKPYNLLELSKKRHEFKFLFLSGALLLEEDKKSNIDKSSSFKNILEKLPKDSIDKNELVIISLLETYLVEKNESTFIENIKLFIKKLGNNKKTAYYLNLISFMIFMIDDEKIYNEVLDLILRKGNSIFHHLEKEINFSMYLTYSAYQDKLFTFVNNYLLYQIYSQKKFAGYYGKTNINPSNNDIFAINKSFISNYKSEILMRIDPYIEISNIHNDIYHFYIENEKWDTPRKVIEEFNFSDIKLTQKNISNTENTKKKAYILTKFIIYLVSSDYQYSKELKSTEDFLLKEVVKIRSINSEISIEPIGSLLLYSVILNKTEIQESIYKILNLKKNSSKIAEKEILTELEPAFISTLERFPEKNINLYKNIVNWIVSIEDRIEYRPWFISGIYKDFLFYIKELDKNVLLNIKKENPDLFNSLEVVSKNLGFETHSCKAYNFLSSIMFSIKEEEKAKNYAVKGLEVAQKKHPGDGWKDHLLNDCFIQFYRIKQNQLGNEILEDILNVIMSGTTKSYFEESLTYLLHENKDLSVLDPILDRLTEYCMQDNITDNHLCMAISKVLYKLGREKESLYLLSNYNDDYQSEYLEKLLEFSFSIHKVFNPTSLIVYFNEYEYLYQSYVKAIIFYCNIYKDKEVDVSFILNLLNSKIPYKQLQILFLSYTLERIKKYHLNKDYSEYLNNII